MTEQALIDELTTAIATELRRAPLTGSLDKDTARFSIVIGEVIDRLPTQSISITRECQTSIGPFSFTVFFPSARVLDQDPT